MKAKRWTAKQLKAMRRPDLEGAEKLAAKLSVLALSLYLTPKPKPKDAA